LRGNEERGPGGKARAMPEERPQRDVPAGRLGKPPSHHVVEREFAPRRHAVDEGGGGHHLGEAGDVEERPRVGTQPAVTAVRAFVHQRAAGEDAGLGRAEASADLALEEIADCLDHQIPSRKCSAPLRMRARAPWGRARLRSAWPKGRSTITGLPSSRRISRATSAPRAAGPSQSTNSPRTTPATPASAPDARNWVRR